MGRRLAVNRVKVFALPTRTTWRILALCRASPGHPSPGLPEGSLGGKPLAQPLNRTAKPRWFSLARDGRGNYPRDMPKMSNHDSVPPTTAADFVRAWKFAGAPAPTKAQLARAEEATGRKGHCLGKRCKKPRVACACPCASCARVRTGRVTAAAVKAQRTGMRPAHGSQVGPRLSLGLELSQYPNEPDEKTRTIAGRKVTLTVGVRYVASRPAAEKGRKFYPVVISRWPIALRPKAEVTIPELSYEESNAFVNAFNNGATSFDGRVW